VWPMILRSGSTRPGYAFTDDGPSPAARAYHNLARAAELLAMWRNQKELPHAEIAYTAAHVMGEAQLWPAADR